MNIKILRHECCGNAECVAIAPAVFALDSKQKAIVLDEGADTPEKLIEAAAACPCGAIVIEDEDGDAVGY